MKHKKDLTEKLRKKIDVNSMSREEAAKFFIKCVTKALLATRTDHRTNLTAEIARGYIFDNYRFDHEFHELVSKHFNGVSEVNGFYRRTISQSENIYQWDYVHHFDWSEHKE